MAGWLGWLAGLGWVAGLGGWAWLGGWAGYGSMGLVVWVYGSGGMVGGYGSKESVSIYSRIKRAFRARTGLQNYITKPIL